MNITIGTVIPWKRFDYQHETNKGAIQYSDWTMSDGYTVYESVAKNSHGVPVVLVIADAADDRILSIIDLSPEDTIDTAYDKLAQAKKRR